MTISMASWQAKSMFENAGKFIFWVLSDYIKKKAPEIWDWLWHGPPSKGPQSSILIVGPGGTGKSTLGRMLAHLPGSLVESIGKYEESIDIETYELNDDPSVEILIPPGQEHRREYTWQALGSDISSGRFRGIIFVGAFGYHNLGAGQSYKRHKLYAGNKREFITAYLEDRRDEELKVLMELIPHIRACVERLWLFTLVTKQDLWWPRRRLVEKFYTEGTYAKQIADLVASKGRTRLYHQAGFASLMISNFETGTGEKLASNAEGYDHARQVKSLEALFQALETFKKWELGT